MDDTTIARAIEGANDIITTSSISAVSRNSLRTYSASKHAVLASMRSLRRRLLQKQRAGRSRGFGMLLNELSDIFGPQEVQLRASAGEGLRSKT